MSGAKTIGGGQIEIDMEKLREEAKANAQKAKPSVKPADKKKPAKGTEDVVEEQKQEEPVINWRKYPLEQPAHFYYQDNDLDQVLPWPAVLDYAWSVERQIRLDELETVAGPDGAMVKCIKTGVIHQPKFSIMPTADVRQAVYQQGDIIKGLYTLDYLPCRGCFYEEGPYFGRMYNRGGDHPGSSVLVQRAKEEAKKIGDDFQPRTGERRGYVWGHAITFKEIRQRIIRAVEGGEDDS